MGKNTPPFGPSFIRQLLDDQHGATTIAELLVVMAVSSILLVAAMNGQEFVTELSRRFFDRAKLETEVRLLLQTLEFDLTRAHAVLKTEEHLWTVIGPNSDTTRYKLIDSNLMRNETSVIHSSVSMRDFSLGPAELQPLRDQPRSRAVGAIQVDFLLTHKGKDFYGSVSYPRVNRAPGS